ncbi:Lsr2 family DNA-binding protein [Nonomuraea dietziae]|uniref:Lsr2 family DNA-binding protein n=1 Tax=Nonomuraea dietziae TaxID=65515 RepID=UPI0033F4C371
MPPPGQWSVRRHSRADPSSSAALPTAEIRSDPPRRPIGRHPGRRTRSTGFRRGGRGGSRGSAAISREKSAEIRQWAKEHGLQVSEGGRISAAVVEQYEAAH